MVIFGLDVPNFLLVKFAAVGAVVGVIAFYEGYTGKKLFGRQEAPPAPHPGEKHMGMVEEVKPGELPGVQR